MLQVSAAFFFGIKIELKVGLDEGEGVRPLGLLPAAVAGAGVGHSGAVRHGWKSSRKTTRLEAKENENYAQETMHSREM